MDGTNDNSRRDFEHVRRMSRRRVLAGGFASLLVALCVSAPVLADRGGPASLGLHRGWVLRSDDLSRLFAK
jgi:hypothetical protein